MHTVNQTFKHTDDVSHHCAELQFSSHSLFVSIFIRNRRIRAILRPTYTLNKQMKCVSGFFCSLPCELCKAPSFLHFHYIHHHVRKTVISSLNECFQFQTTNGKAEESAIEGDRMRKKKVNVHAHHEMKRERREKKMKSIDHSLC